jgi:hypothetical protein
MSKQKFMLGPWTFQFDGDGGDFFIKSETTGETIVAGGLSRDFELDGREHQQLKETVRLIAAAPEMLEALKEAIETIKFLSTRDNSWGEQIVCEDLQAIVAKATGSQS